MTIYKDEHHRNVSPPSPPSHSLKGHSPERRKILIVDDKAENLAALRQVLRGVDAEVVDATSGNQALAASLDHDFAMALLDVQMPGMSGYELAEHLRGDEKTRCLPIIFLTAHFADEQHIFKGYESGGVDFIVKPFNPDILIGKVNVFLELDRYKAELERHRDHLEKMVAERTAMLAARVKEVRCLYSVSSLVVEPCESIEKSLQTAVDLIASGWLYSDLARARIIFNIGVYTSQGFRESAWKQSADIVLSGATVGAVEVFYLEETPALDEGPFLKEERELINDIARQLGVMIQRERAEKALALSEIKYRRLFEAAKDGILIIDAETGAILDVNPFMAELIGRPQDQIVGKEMWELGFLGDSGAAKEHFRKLQQEGYVRYEDLPLQSADGRLIETELVSNVYVADQKRIVQCHIRDITDRKRAETAQRETEQQYRELVENLNDVVYSLDKEGRIIYISPVVEKGFGYSPAEIVGRPLTELVQPEDGTAIQTAIQDVLTGLEYPSEFRILTKTGDVRWVRSSSRPLFDEGKIEGLTGVLTDITDSKSNEDRLRFQAQILDSISDLVVATEAEGKIAYINQAVCKTLGRPGETLIGQPLQALGDSPTKGSTFDEIIKGTLAEGHWRGQMLNTTAGGQEIILDTRTQLMFNQQGSHVGIIKISSDITEMVSVEEQLRHAQKMESIGRLAGGVAHDFNNMLSIINGYSQMALLSLSESDPLYADVNEILKAGRRSSELTKQLLAFARRQTVMPVVLNLNELIQKSEKMMGRLLGEDIELRLNLCEDIWKVQMDPSQIDQILVNLAVNARDAITDTGVITIDTSNVVVDQVHASQYYGFKPGVYVLLSLSDTGSGMDKETVKKIFEPFFSTKKEGHGTGLGLSTVYGIVKQNDGMINVYSEPNVGTTFKIYLPRTDLDTEVLAADTAEMPLTGSETILVVEDEEQILELCGQILRMQGYKVITSRSPGEALIMCEKYQDDIQLLVTDVIMPHMNGKELKERLESLRPGLKVLFMSGYTADIIAHRGVLAEGFAYIQKPFSMEDLARKVRMVLDS